MQADTGRSVAQGLNLFLKLQDPARMPELLAAIGAQMDVVHRALQSLHYVHYARFLPAPDGSVLMVITEFDGDLKSYIMDFVAVLGDTFSAILAFVADAPRLPVQRYPQDFWAFVQANNLAQAQPWSAYPQRTVIDIQGPRTQLPPPVAEPAAAALDLADIQGCIVRGYRAEFARHFALSITDAARAKAFIASLVSGDPRHGLQITSARVWNERPAALLNLGLSWDGLAALGLPAPTLQQFPEAFRQGPAARCAQVQDDPAEATQWVLGAPGVVTHLVLSLFVHGDLGRLESVSQQLRARFAEFALVELSCHDAAALPGGQVHFGYRDGIAQPRIAGAPGCRADDLQPASSAGEFLLGKGYLNPYGGNFAGDLPAALVDNGSYAALRILEQDVAAFERLIADAGARHGMSPELVAAKLMGRWRDGSPLSLAPDAPMEAPRGAPSGAPTGALARKRPADALNAFDYAPTAEHPAVYDDSLGLRCPIGAHMRRLNPRGALVSGKPHSRRIIRRGMPYGPAFDPARPDDGFGRGLIGLFICGDLEMQFEFLLNVWANGDIATSGLAGTRDPILGAQPAEGGPFVIRTGDGRDPIRLNVPRLVRTRGSVYLFLPGLGALRALAAG